MSTPSVDRLVSAADRQWRVLGVRPGDLPRGTHVPIWPATGVFYGGVAAVVVAGAAIGVRVLSVGSQ